MSPSKKSDSLPDPSTLAYEAAAEELESILQQIDDGDVGLESAMALHRRGQALVQRCRTLLDAADEELQQLSVDDLTTADGDD